MKKKSLLSRISVLSDGRKYYLEYLRNLTPQVILFTFAILVGAKINGATLDYKSAFSAFMFISFMILFAIAFYANTTTFYENCYGRLGMFVKRVRFMCKSKGYTTFKTHCVVMKSLLSCKLVEFLEVVFVFWFLQLTLAVVITVAIFQAYGMLKHG